MWKIGENSTKMPIAMNQPCSQTPPSVKWSMMNRKCVNFRLRKANENHQESSRCERLEGHCRD